MVSNAKTLAEIQMKKSKAISMLQEYEIPGFLLPAIVHLENQDDEAMIKSMEKELIQILIYNLDKQFIRFECSSEENFTQTKVYAGTRCQIEEHLSGQHEANFLAMESSLYKEIILQDELLLNQAKLDIGIIFNSLIKGALQQTQRFAHIQNKYTPLANLVNHIMMLRFLEILHLSMERIVSDKRMGFFNLKTPFYLIGHMENCKTLLIYSFK